jgi:hypothetical protein
MKKYIKNGVVKNAEDIVIRGKARFIFHPTEEQILAAGWVEYIEPPKPEYKKSPFEIVEELVTKQWNERTDIANEEALDYMTIVYDWEHYLGQVVPVGKIVVYRDKLWRVRQEHTVMWHYPPSLETSSLYEIIEKEHSGELDDPIPYNPPMEIFNGKYYTEDNIKYLCIRNSETALSHNLSSLVGLYVKTV